MNNKDFHFTSLYFLNILLLFILLEKSYSAIPESLGKLAPAGTNSSSGQRKAKEIVVPAEVIPNPTGYAQIHVDQTARLIVDPHYPMPKTGEKIEEGQVIAIVETVISKADDIGKRTELHKIESDIEKVNHEVKRLETLGNFSARKELEDKRIDLQRFHKQREVILNRLGTEFLRSPIGGILNSSYRVFPGQVFKPEDPLVEIIKPGHIWIVAYLDNPLYSQRIQKGYGRFPSQPQKHYPLKLIGIAPKLNKDQKQELLFDLVSPDSALLIGMKLEVCLSFEEEEGSP